MPRSYVDDTLSGVEVTTGTLGQGIASGGGLAMAQANLAATYNRERFPLFSNKTYGERWILDDAQS